MDELMDSMISVAAITSEVAETGSIVGVGGDSAS